MVDVLLTHSYHLFYDPKQIRKMQPYPPLGTLYAAALLRMHGFSVALFDTMLQDPGKGFAEALHLYRPRLVALYEDNFNFLSKMCLTRMRAVAYGMLDAAAATGSKVIASGSDASDHTEEYLRRGFDYVLRGEAEWTLVELVKELLGNSDCRPEQIPGVTFLDPATDELVQSPRRPLLRDLDTLPLPARDLIQPELYRNAWRERHGFFSMNLVASRGCPYRCNWCARPIYGDSFHVRSAEGVAEEMKELKARYGADHLWFADDVFGLRHRWVEELAEGSNGALLAFPSRFNLESIWLPRRWRPRCAGPGVQKCGWGSSPGRRRFSMLWKKARAWNWCPWRARTCAAKEFAPASFSSSATRAKPGKTFRIPSNWCVRHARKISESPSLILFPEPGSTSGYAKSWERRETGWTVTTFR